MKEEVVIKGFVAVDNCADKMTWNPTGRRVLFFPQMPFRDFLTDKPYWCAPFKPYGIIELGHECFQELSWEDDPMEVELKILKK